MRTISLIGDFTNDKPYSLSIKKTMLSVEVAESSIFIILFGIVGASVGSFVNVCLDRLPLQFATDSHSQQTISLLFPSRSFCFSCKHFLSWFENIPIVSYLLLQGRCAHCQTLIPQRILWVELSHALVYLLSWWFISNRFVMILVCLHFSFWMICANFYWRKIKFSAHVLILVFLFFFFITIFLGFHAFER